MKQILCLLLLMALLLTMVACGNDAVASNIATTEVPTTEVPTTQVPTTQVSVPEPPLAQDHLADLWETYSCTQTDVTVNGLQAEYTVEATQDNQFVDCSGTYRLILEYDPAADTWNTVKSNWATKTHKFDIDVFLENNVWVVSPDAESQGITLTLDQIVTGRCRIRWESQDEALTINGSATGEAYCTYKISYMDGDTDAPCWLIQAVEVTYGDETYYLQIRPDSVCMVREPFGEQAVGSITFVKEDNV